MQVEPVVRLNKLSRETLKIYSDDVNKSISAMHILIDYQKKEIEKLKAVTDSLQLSHKNTTSVHDEIYWKQLEALFIRFAPYPKPPSNGFVTGTEFPRATATASKLVVTPVKDYSGGKIGPDEQLAEPRGKGGKEIR